MKERYVFPAVFHYADDGISISFPDLAGCLSHAQCDEEALVMAREALSLHLFGMEEDNECIPAPSSLRSIAVAPNEVVVLIDVWMLPFRERMANKSVNKTVTIPKWLNELAEQQRVNFSHLLQSALKQHLGVKHC
jgi:predicted RNase H-like HicB family nuclease